VVSQQRRRARGLRVRSTEGGEGRGGGQGAHRVPRRSIPAGRLQAEARRRTLRPDAQGSGAGRGVRAGARTAHHHRVLSWRRADSCASAVPRRRRAEAVLPGDGRAGEAMPVEREWAELLVNANDPLVPYLAVMSGVESLHRMTRDERDLEGLIVPGSDHLTAYNVYADAYRVAGYIGEVYGLPRH